MKTDGVSCFVVRQDGGVFPRGGDGFWESSTDENSSHTIRIFERRVYTCVKRMVK